MGLLESIKNIVNSESGEDKLNREKAEAKKATFEKAQKEPTTNKVQEDYDLANQVAK